MTMKNRMKSFTITFLVAVFCLSNILGTPGFSAQAAGKNDPTLSAQLAPEDVTVQVSESEEEMDQILAVQAGTDQYWAHGNTLMLESQTSGVSVAHYGYGSEVRATSAQNGQGIAWVHFSVPTPSAPRLTPR